MASERDIQDVINTLIAEGNGEGQEGMRRIAETILNRAEQRGISPAEVVRQRAQYTGYAHPGPAAVQAQHNPQAISAAQAAWALAQGPDDPTGGANHYFNPNIVTPTWARSMTPTGTYQNHAFYTDRPVPPRSIRAPLPNSQSGSLIMRRANTSPSGGDTGLQAALNQIATRQANAVTPVMRRPELPPMGSPDVNAIYAGIYPQQSVMRPTNTLTTGGRNPIGMVSPGNLDLDSRRILTDGVGGFKTENSISIGTDQGEVLIPTVVNGKQLSEQAAIDHYQRTGENLGTFQTPQAADRYAESLHQRQDQRYSGSVPKAVPQSTIDRGVAGSPMIPVKGSLTQPGAISKSVQSAGSVQNPALAAALARSIASPKPVPQSQIERSAPRPVVQSAPVAAPVVSKPRVTVSTPYTTPQSTIERGTPRTQTIGQPPATRVVKSVPMPPIAPAVDVKPQATFVPQSTIDRGAPRTAPAQPYKGPFVPSSNIDRLPTSSGLAIAPQQTYQQPYVKPVMQAPVQVAQAPVQMPRPRPTPPAVATQLSVAPMVAAPRPAAPAPVVRAANPLRIEVSAGAPVMRPALTAIQQLQAQGLTAAQAYAQLTANTGGPRTAADRPGKSLSQSGGQAGMTEGFW